MKKFWKNFFLRGFISMGFGPIILIIVYACLHANHVITVLSVNAVNLAIISTLIIAFVQGSSSAIFQAEHLSLGQATLIQSLLIYFTLIFLYLINSWIQLNPLVILIFSICYWLSYLIIWLTIFLVIRNQVKKANAKL